MNGANGRLASSSESLVTGETRRSFLKKAGVGGIAVVGGGTLLGAVAGSARAGNAGDNVPDVDVLNYALTLEYLEAAFYTQGLGGNGTIGVSSSSARFSESDIYNNHLLTEIGGRVQRLAYGHLIEIRNHEIAHVDFLRTALGSAAVRPCTYDFSSGLSSVTAFFTVARVLENTGVMAYDGAIRYIDSGDYLQAGAQIATIEARHASYLNVLHHESPFPDPFDTGKKPSEIFAAAKGFLVSCPPEVVALFGRLP